MNVNGNYDKSYKNLSTKSEEKDIIKKAIKLWKNKKLKKDTSQIKYECPKELIPINNICPKEFPKIINNCCSKDLNYIKKYNCCNKNFKYINVLNCKKTFSNDESIFDKKANYNYTDLQKEAIKIYTGSSYSILSKFTRNNLKINEEITKYMSFASDFNDYIKELKKKKNIVIGNDYQLLFENVFKDLYSCSKHKYDNNLIVFRGITSTVDYKEGSFIQSNTFVSTTLLKKITNTFGGNITLLKIYIPKHTKVCPLYADSQLKNEAEILLKYGTVFYVKSIKKGTPNTVELVVIDGDYAKKYIQQEIKKVTLE